MSNVEPLIGFCSAAELGVSEAVMLRPAAPMFDPRSTQPLVTNDVVCSIHCRPRMRINAQCGCHDTHSGKTCGARKMFYTATEINPRAVHAPGVSTGCCLSLWALIDPGGVGVSRGMDVARISACFVRYV